MPACAAEEEIRKFATQYGLRLIGGTKSLDAKQDPKGLDKNT